MTTPDREPEAHLPAWVADVQPGTLDRRVLDQDRLWITAGSAVLQLTEMSTEHLANVLGMLQDTAMQLHLAAMLDALEACLASVGTEQRAAEQLTYDLTGRSIADESPLVWLESTTLVRALRGELRRRERL